MPLGLRASRVLATESAREKRTASSIPGARPSHEFGHGHTVKLEELPDFERFKESRCALDSYFYTNPYICHERKPRGRKPGCLRHSPINYYCLQTNRTENSRDSTTGPTGLFRLSVSGMGTPTSNTLVLRTSVRMQNKEVRTTVTHRLRGSTRSN